MTIFGIHICMQEVSALVPLFTAAVMGWRMLFRRRK